MKLYNNFTTKLWRKPMKQKVLLPILMIILSMGMVASLTSCKQNRGAGETLVAVPVDPEEPVEPENVKLHSIFNQPLGKSISYSLMGTLDADVTGNTVLDDYDGDGLKNSEETFTNEYVADIPKIVTRITTPVIMEIEVDESSTEKNHVEIVEEEDVKDTITNSMEDKHYTSLNKKTTPYVTRESYEDSAGSSSAYGYDNVDSFEHATAKSSSFANSTKFSFFGAGGQGANNKNGFGSTTEVSNQGSQSSSEKNAQSTKRSENSNIAENFKKAKMTEKTVFEDVNYIDNMNKNGIEFTSETVKKMTKNYRKNKDVLTSTVIGPNAGVVSTGLFLKNPTLNMPIRVSKIRCTLSFRIPTGKQHHVETFMLHDNNNVEISEVVGGGEELGPYTIKINGLKTEKIKTALAKGYIPQIHVVSYKMDRVRESWYNPGVDDLKMVEENLKGRTAVIKIIGKGMRDIYRVNAFDVTKNNGEITVTPGISLKKALFNIMRNRTGNGESFKTDDNGRTLTVEGDGIKWKEGAVNTENHSYKHFKGNSWEFFETYVKTYTDEFNREHYFETIKRVGREDDPNLLKKYNPFLKEDNESYNPNQLLSEDEFFKMKYWVIFHNGRYFEGDINDPIWAGERFEILHVDIYDFNKHFANSNFYYTALQSQEPIYFSTRWNNKMEEINIANPFPRARYLGKVFRGDVINLEVNLVESRFLLNSMAGDYSDSAVRENYDSGYAWHSNLFSYNLQLESGSGEGKPGEFSHLVEGSINNITLEINKSSNAHYYIISFPNSELKKVKISADDLTSAAGRIVISRNTPSSDGGTVGFVEGALGDGKEYTVNVRAYGISQGTYGSVKLYTESTSNWNSRSKAEVKNPDVAQLAGKPGPFSYGVSSTIDEIRVNISDSENTEYFLIKYRGPLTSEYDPDLDDGSSRVDSETIVGRHGMNKISVMRPNDRDIEGGVYYVDVVPVNRNNMSEQFKIDLVDQFDNIKANSTLLLPERQFLEVKFDKYAAQKEFLPKKTNRLFELKDLNNLEISFNNNDNEWYRLVVFNEGDTVSDGRRKLDARLTSYMDYANQRFHIAFKPPQGEEDDYGNTYNIFRGGREEVEVYIRTIKKEEYRDRFWLKPQIKSENGSGEIEYSFIYTNTYVGNFIEYWISGEEIASDATELEHSVASEESIKDKDINNYFFSPLEYYCYRLKASVSDRLYPSHEENRPPIFIAESGEESIKVQIQDIPGDFSEDENLHYVVSWRPYDEMTNIIDEYGKISEETGLVSISYDLTEDINLPPWKKMTFYSREFQIEGLQKNREYLVAVKLETDYSHSKVNVSKPIRPYSNDIPFAPDSIDIDFIQTGIGNIITLSNVYVQDEYRYEIQYKSIDKNEWSTYPRVNFIYNQEKNDQAVEEEIDDIKTWKSYQVRVRAITGSGKEGDFWTSDIISPKLMLPKVAYESDGNNFKFCNIFSKEGERIFDVEYCILAGACNEDDYIPVPYIWGSVYELRDWVTNEQQLPSFETLFFRFVPRPGVANPNKFITQPEGPFITKDPNFNDNLELEFEFYPIDKTTFKRGIKVYRYEAHREIVRPKRLVCKKGKCKYKRRTVVDFNGWDYYSKMRILIKQFQLLSVDENGNPLEEKKRFKEFRISGNIHIGDDKFPFNTDWVSIPQEGEKILNDIYVDINAYTSHKDKAISKGYPGYYYMGYINKVSKQEFPGGSIHYNFYARIGETVYTIRTDEDSEHKITISPFSID